MKRLERVSVGVFRYDAHYRSENISADKYMVDRFMRLACYIHQFTKCYGLTPLRMQRRMPDDETEGLAVKIIYQDWSRWLY